MSKMKEALNYVENLKREGRDLRRENANLKALQPRLTKAEGRVKELEENERIEISDLRDSLEKMKAQRDGANNRIKYLEAGIQKAKNELGVL